MMHKTYPPSEATRKAARISPQQYEAMYQGSIENPEIFWTVQAARLDWFQKPRVIKNTSFDGDIKIKWYEDGILNACYNCVDRHLEKNGDKIAFIFEGDNPGESRRISFKELHREICLFANALKSRNVKKGDRVTIYMPMIPEAAIAMLACARIGAIHSVVFGGFSPDALRDRIRDCDSHVVITADEGRRGGKTIPLKKNTDQAVSECPDVHTVFVYKRTGADTPWDKGRDLWWRDAIAGQPEDCPCERMNAEDPLFILYTSGSTGKPKGVLHTTGGYLVYAAMTHETVFDIRADDVYWCTADVGWVTGHSYIVYGPLANATTSLIFEGVPNYPDYSRFWRVVDTHQVSVFYTAPTAIRALLREGDAWVRQTDRSSLRVLGTVGEPINEEAWLWYYKIVGDARCPVVDTWWQTETGGHMMTPFVSMDLIPGYAMKPFFGVKPALVDNDGAIIDGEGEGNFVILDSWPGQMRGVYGDPKRFKDTYFSTFPGMYFTGDGARRDANGNYRITGRVDDVINVSGHRLGTAEIESAINEHEAVAESAVVGYPHEIKGQGIYAYIILNAGTEPDESIKGGIIKTVRRIIGPIASPDMVLFAPGLPKTRSGKIMRRILRKIAAGETESLGDTSTLADPSVVDVLIERMAQSAL